MAKILQLKARIVGVNVYQAITRWLTLKPASTRRQYLSAAKAWSRHLGCELDDERSGPRWVKAKHQDALDYCNNMATRPAQDERHGTISAGTVRHHAVILKSIYDELVAQGVTELNPFIRVVTELKPQDQGHRRPHKRVPTDAVTTLLDWTPRTEGEVQELAIMSLFFGAALRRSEVINIRIGDLSQTERGTTVLTLIHTKAQRAQTVALADWVAARCKDWIKKRFARGATARDPLFVRYDRLGAHPLTDSTVYRMFKRICEEAGIGEWTPHCARVTAITQLLDQGVDHRSVQELSRHASVQMVEKYDRKRIDADNSASKKIEYKK